MDRFSKGCLLIIILLLVIIAARPIVSPQSAIAAEQYTYRVVNTTVYPSAIQTELNQRTAEGWEFATPVVSEQISGVTLIFRKPAP